MLLHILIGASVMLLCLILQAAFVIVCLRNYARLRLHQRRGRGWRRDILLLSVVMLLMLLSNFIQVSIWAATFLWLGEFRDFETALYHSGVNFAGLGYGDIVMSVRWRLLGPIEAANGILMFGVSTAMITAAILDLIKFNREGRQDEERL